MCDNRKEGCVLSGSLAMTLKLFHFTDEVSLGSSRNLGFSAIFSSILVSKSNRGKSLCDGGDPLEKCHGVQLFSTGSSSAIDHRLIA